MKGKNQIKRHRMWFVGGIIIVLVGVGVLFMNQPQFGRAPRGERLERIRQSSHYKDGKFQNIHDTKQITAEGGFAGVLWDFLFGKRERVRPDTTLPVVKTDLWQLDRKQDVMVWFGHSSYLIQQDGKRILVDPVFLEASPVPFSNRPFRGPDVYTPQDIPDVDYLVISHDHWDHLDYKTVRALKDRIGKVVCALGVGEHLEYWGFDPSRIVELDWNEEALLDPGFMVYCLPARHFSGRGLSPNTTLWASFLIRTPSQQIYIGGDSGYDSHYAEIGERFGEIDLAVLENGQYDKDWKYIHLMPEYLGQAIRDLKAKRTVTVHHGKYALAKHAWDEPFENAAMVAEKDSLDLIIPMIGEIIELDAPPQKWSKWWEEVR